MDRTRAITGMVAITALVIVGLSMATTHATARAEERPAFVALGADRAISDRYQAFVALGSCAPGEPILDSIVELAPPDVGAPVQADPTEAMHRLFEKIYPGLVNLDTSVERVAITDVIHRIVLVRQGLPTAYVDVVLNGVGNWAVAGWTACAGALGQGTRA